MVVELECEEEATAWGQAPEVCYPSLHDLGIEGEENDSTGVLGRRPCCTHVCLLFHAAQDSHPKHQSFMPPGMLLSQQTESRA